MFKKTDIFKEGMKVKDNIINLILRIAQSKRTCYDN